MRIDQVKVIATTTGSGNMLPASDLEKKINDAINELLNEGYGTANIMPITSPFEFDGKQTTITGALMLIAGHQHKL